MLAQNATPVAQNARMGPRGRSCRLLLDFSGCDSGLWNSLGSSLGASGTLSVFFSNFLAPSGIIFSKSLDITFVLQADEQLEIYFSFFFKFGFPKIMVVTSQTEIPKVVSSCYRAGNWEWV